MQSEEKQVKSVKSVIIVSSRRGNTLYLLEIKVAVCSAECISFTCEIKYIDEDMYPIAVYMKLQGILKYEFLIVIEFKVVINQHKVARTFRKKKRIYPFAVPLFLQGISILRN